MKNLLLSGLLLLSLFSCQEHEMASPEQTSIAVCGVTNPLKDLPWLRKQIQESRANTDYCTLWQVTQGDYEGKTVYLVVVGGALCCTCGNTVVDCEGEVVFSCDLEKENKIANKKVIWQRK